MRFLTFCVPLCSKKAQCVVYIREGVLKRSIVYLSWKNRLLQIFYDLASEVMNEGKYSSEDQGLD